MPTFDAPIENNQIHLFVDVGLPQAPDSRTRCRALVDTGATITGVTSKVIDALGAETVGKREVLVATGEQVSLPEYRLNVGIPITTHQYNDDRTAMEQHTYVSGGELMVTLLPDLGDGIDALQGMDLLLQFHITMYGGRFVLSN